MGYGFTIRVKGKYALFTRPEMKVERVSYDIITPSAARGIIEAVYWKPAIRWRIDRILVMNEIRFTNIRRNEVSDKVSTHNAEQYMQGNRSGPFYLDILEKRQQRAALVLQDVDYIIQAHFELTALAGPDDSVEKHYNIALRRLRKGQYFHAPYLGTREFGAEVELIDYGLLPASPLSGKLDLGWMLYDLDFTDATDITPHFFRAVLQDGLLDLSSVEIKP